MRIVKDLRVSRGEEGIHIVLVSLLIVGIIGIVGLAVDGAAFYKLKSDLQTAMDLCAYKGGQLVQYDDSVDEAEIQNIVRNSVVQNLIWNLGYSRSDADEILPPANQLLAYSPSDDTVSCQASLRHDFFFLKVIPGMGSGAAVEARAVNRFDRFALVFVFDHSGSMAEEEALLSGSRWDRLISGAATFSQNLEEGDAIGIVRFSDTDELTNGYSVDLPLSIVSSIPGPGLVTRARLAEVFNTLAAEQPVGGTDLERGLRAGRAEFDNGVLQASGRSYQKALVLFTDGTPRREPADLSDPIGTDMDCSTNEYPPAQWRQALKPIRFPDPTTSNYDPYGPCLSSPCDHNIDEYWYLDPPTGALPHPQYCECVKGVAKNFWNSPRSRADWASLSWDPALCYDMEPSIFIPSSAENRNRPWHKVIYSEDSNNDGVLDDWLGVFPVNDGNGDEDWYEGNKFIQIHCFKANPNSDPINNPDPTNNTICVKGSSEILPACHYIEDIDTQYPSGGGDYDFISEAPILRIIKLADNYREEGIAVHTISTGNLALNRRHVYESKTAAGVRSFFLWRVAASAEKYAAGDEDGVRYPTGITDGVFNYDNGEQSPEMPDFWNLAASHGTNTSDSCIPRMEIAVQHRLHGVHAHKRLMEREDVAEAFSDVYNGRRRSRLVE